MEELNNGVKLCRLAEILQSKIPKDCLLDKNWVSQLQSATFPLWVFFCVGVSNLTTVYFISSFL